MFNQNKLSKFEILWLGVIFWAVTYTAIEVPFSLIFSQTVDLWQVILDGVLCIIFIIDVIYHIKTKHAIMQSQKKKKKKSFKKRLPMYSMFLVDILACIPVEVIGYFSGATSGLIFFKILRLARLVRIAKLISLFGTINFLPKHLKFQIMFIACIVAVHWITCGWIMIHPPGEMAYFDYYVKSLYWAVTTLTTIGYGDISPTTTVGRLYTMVIMILGVGVYGVVIGNVSRLLSQADRYKEKSKEKVTDLTNFMRYYKIPDRLQNSVFGYYNHIYAKRLSDNDTQIISDLPHALQNELQTYMNMKLISSVPVFKTCSIGCLKKVSSALKQKFYSPGQTIIQIGEMGHEMFIIGHGKVEVILKDGSVVATLHEGQFFGEIALLQETTRNANIRAQSYCDLYILEKEDFSLIIDQHEELLTSIENSTKKRSTDRKPRN